MGAPQIGLEISPAVPQGIGTENMSVLRGTGELRETPRATCGIKPFKSVLTSTGILE